MRTRLLFSTIKFVFVLCVVFTPVINAQDYSTKRVWSDGMPFKKTSSDTNVKVDTVITLKPRYDVSGTDDTLSIALFGLDWSWPVNDIEISSAEDIDYRIVSDQELYLVTDALGRKIIEIKPNTGEVVWSFGSKIVSDPAYLDRPVDSDIFQEQGLFKIVVTDEGRNRIIKVDKETRTLEWQYGDPDGRAGNGPNQLNDPVDAVHVPGTTHYIVADKGNSRIIVVNETDNSIVWSFKSDTLVSPVDVEYISAYNYILVTDQGSHTVFLVDYTTGKIVWVFGQPNVPGNSDSQLNAPTDADYLSDGNIMIADAGNNRLIEVDPAGNIVWRFRRKLPALKDVDLLPDNKLLIISEMYPARLGYSDSLIVSKVYDLGENREANFDNVSWTAETIPGVTDVDLQLRSANSLSELETATWYGPNGENTFYTEPGKVSQTVHQGHRFYQFRAYLKTNDPLQTPVLTKVLLTYHFYDIGKTGVFWSQILKEPGDTLVAKWKTFTFVTDLPADPAKRDKIAMELRINDGNTFKTLATFPASITDATNEFNLESVASLIGVQAIQLVGYISTADASVSPTLKSWKIEWEAVPTSSASIKFINKKGVEASYYRASTTLPAQEAMVDSVILQLTDRNLEYFTDKITLSVDAKISGDHEDVELLAQGLGIFKETPPMPILISNSFSPLNQILEVADRDTLVVSYVNPNNSDNKDSTSILIIKNTTGEMTVFDQNGAPVSIVDFNTQLFVRIKNEQDRNIDPNAQEVISVTMYDRATVDEEKVLLYEVPDNNGQYNTGEFVSHDGILIVRNNNGVKNDGQLQSLAGHNISIEYEDNVPLIETVSIPSEPGGNFVINLRGAPYIVEVAPNPYYENKNLSFKLRVASATGSIIVRKIEIFTLAGEKVREIDGNSLIFSTGIPVPNEKYGVVENWWNLMSDSGHKVSSGTYWVKVHADIIHEDTNDLERVAFFKKFVVVR